MSFVYLPVFFELNITSCFTYLELRFGRKVRSIASVIYAISCLVQAPIIMYTPALALNQGSLCYKNIYLLTNQFKSHSYWNKRSLHNTGHQFNLYFLHNGGRIKSCCLDRHPTVFSHGGLSCNSLHYWNIYDWRLK